MKILGIRYGHSAAAAITINGEIVANVMEERFTRIKNDGSFPENAIKWCLDEAKIDAMDLDAIALPNIDLPLPCYTFFQPSDDSYKINYITKDESNPLYRRNLGSNIVNKPKLPVYIKPWQISNNCEFYCVEHHLGHAASAYFTSGITDDALIFTLDGRGDDVSSAVWLGKNGNEIKKLEAWNGGSSLGWFYATVTEALGWRHGSDEWKVMGLAPYGKPVKGILEGFHPEFKNGDLIKSVPFGEADRWPDHGVNHYHFDLATDLSKQIGHLSREAIAAETQAVAEEQLLNLVLPWIEKFKIKKACFAGGFFLNVKANQKLWETGKLDVQWIYSDPGDSGLPVGVCFYVDVLNRKHALPQIKTLYHGPSFDNDEIKEILIDRAIEFEYFEDIEGVTANYLSQNYIVGWFQGRMEAGPRALGNRSILMSPIDPGNKDLINLKVKFREPFRPFCPSMLEEVASNYLEHFRQEHFMVTSFQVKEELKDQIPAVVHVDGTARPQMVTNDRNPRFYNLLKKFEAKTGHAVLLNTSFNVKGEPIVCNPREAIKCFYDNGLDILVLGNYLIKKKNIS